MHLDVRKCAIVACLSVAIAGCSGKIEGDFVLPGFDAGTQPEAGQLEHDAAVGSMDASQNSADAAPDASQMPDASEMPDTGAAPDATPQPPAAVCGDGKLANVEACDDGNRDNADGCDADCEVEAGWQCPANLCARSCGNTRVDEGESCDDGNSVTEACSYGSSSCTVCDATCHKVAGVVTACGDGHTDGPDEDCDDANTQTESCAYGSKACTVCNASCKHVAGATKYCGNGSIESSQGEACDDGNETAGDGCNALCKVEYVASCGNNTLDTGEQCDDGNTTNLDGCTAACKIDNGWTCPSVGTCHETCGDLLKVGAEVCDDGNQVDTDYCNNTCRTAHSCGDHTQQASAGEQCDDGNTVTEACSYGQMSCTVCNATCHNSAGATSYCGDGIVQAANSEECEPGSDIRCGSDCKFACDTVYITYGTTGNFQLTGTTAGLGDGSWPQTGGTLIVALPAGPTGPVNGAAGITYMRSPLMMTQTISLGGTTTIVTNIVGSSGMASNRCPLDASTLTGTQLIRGTCPYLGSHGTANWTPTEQQVASPNGPGCLVYASSGTITCSGGLCATAGLMSGTNQVNDQWDQPGATFVFSNAFAHVQARALGTPAAGSGQPTDKLEIPNTASGRSWVNFDGTETSRICAKKPTTCPAPGAQ
jgi:cysteine-rich repeat protein